MVKEPKKRKRLDELSAEELVAMTQVEKEALAYKEGHHIKRRLQVEEQA